jgi:hypothetical protein
MKNWKVKVLAKAKDFGPDQTCRLLDSFCPPTRDFKHIKFGVLSLDPYSTVMPDNGFYSSPALTTD